MESNDAHSIGEENKNSGYTYNQDDIFEGIIGKSPCIKNLLINVRQVLDSNATLLIAGENGTGKELIAQAIHCNSKRKSAPFVPVNCGAVPEQLLESELFGYEKGAFTGAYKKKKGKFQTANGGTIFLDEISETSANMQVTLLRVLQEKEVVRVGASSPEKVDVRIIAATNCNLYRMVANGTFREDLYYRLDVLKLEIPTLRQRREDIPLLVDYFLEKNISNSNASPKKVTPRAMQILRKYNWPGNVRQLENLINKAAVTSGNKKNDLDLQYFFKPMFEDTLIQPEPQAELALNTVYEMINNCGGDKNMVAEQLGVACQWLDHKVMEWKSLLGTDKDLVSGDYYHEGVEGIQESFPINYLESKGVSESIDDIGEEHLLAYIELAENGTELLKNYNRFLYKWGSCPEEKLRYFYQSIHSILICAESNAIELSQAIRLLFRFVNESQNVIMKCKELADNANKITENAFTESITRLLRTISHHSRARIWVVKPGESDYFGVRAFRMGGEVANMFSNRVLPKLPIKDATYQQLTGTSCLVLNYGAVKKFLDNTDDRDPAHIWYKNIIGFGSEGVIETYTWHIPIETILESENGFVIDTPKSEPQWALSFDLSVNRICDTTIIRMMDCLIRYIERNLQKGLKSLYPNDYNTNSRIDNTNNHKEIPDSPKDNEINDKTTSSRPSESVNFEDCDLQINSDFRMIIGKICQCPNGGRCKKSKKDRCVSETELIYAIKHIKTEGDLFFSTYLLYAAGYCIMEKEIDNEIDPCFTASSKYMHHMTTGKPLKEVFDEILQANPGSLKIRGPSKGKLGKKFENYVKDNKGVIQSVVNNIAIEYKGFAHTVPYWLK